MDRSIEALVQEWEFIRQCIKAFISELSDSDLDRKLPRKGLDTIRKHVQEMIAVQRDYTRAIESGVMTFNDTSDDEIDGLDSKVKLIEDIQEADNDLFTLLSKAKADREVVWFGTNRLLPYHLAALISHEAMHLGQIIAFCYGQNIDIPDFVKNNWALSGR